MSTTTIYRQRDMASPANLPLRHRACHRRSAGKAARAAGIWLACGRAGGARYHDGRRAGSQARRYLRSRQPLARHRLPVMRRHASALAGPGTAVSVGGKRFEVPVKIRSGPFVAHEGYFTEGHMFGAIRAGTISYRLKTRPARMAVGEQWTLEGDGRVIIYRIENSNSEGKLRIARKDEPGDRSKPSRPATGCGSSGSVSSQMRGVGAGSTSHSMKRATSASRWKARRSYRDRQRRAAGRDDRHQPFPYAAGLGRGEASPRDLLPRRRSPDRGDDDRPQLERSRSQVDTASDNRSKFCADRVVLTCGSKHVKTRIHKLRFPIESEPILML